MKTIEIEDGTQFLLCTDGITRHIPDHELRQLLLLKPDLSELCEELKHRCYERGAEDNLTAVLVRVGKTIATDERTGELERTISPETRAAAAVSASVSEQNGRDHLVPPSRIAFPGPRETVRYEPHPGPLNIDAPAPRSTGGGMAKAIWFVLALVAIAGAFYAGQRYKGRIPFLSPAATIPQPTPSPVPIEDPTTRFERARIELDNDPAAWLTTVRTTEMSAQNIQNPLDSNDPKFLYLFGRASFMVGNNDDAAQAFETVLTKTAGTTDSNELSLRKEATLGLAATALRDEKQRPLAMTHLEEMLPKPGSSPSP